MRISEAIVDQALERELRIGARSLARAGLVHAYGHCSVRLDAKSLLVNAPKPLGLLTPQDAGDVVGVDAPLPSGVLGEVRIHQAIYRSRPDVEAICRVTPPTVGTLSTMGITPLARHGFGAYFAPEPPLWKGTGLIRDEASAAAVADQLGPEASAIVLRGNGAVLVAQSLRQAVVLAWYLEDAARVELAVLQTPGVDGLVLTADEARQRATWQGGVLERMWSYLADGDEELPPEAQ
jgi:HCOMODA/2-hydroxy-3-carboxy-muconic semialdehyde decarboxylase